MEANAAPSRLSTLSLREERFVRILRKLIGHARKLQNAPGAGLVPEERLAAEVVLDELKPHLASGFIQAESLAGKGHEARPSLVLTVRGQTEQTLGFVGAHFDVVPADKEKQGWKWDPFELRVEPDGTLYGRGVTDCLGHVALITDLLAQLAEQGIRPKRTLKVVFIANEEDSPIAEIGLDYVASQGRLNDLKGSPVYWLDSANIGPTLGTAGVAMWQLDVKGFAGHSGMPQNCVNALELGMAAVLALTDYFRRRFPPRPEEKEWNFLAPSSLKATIIQAKNDKVTIIPSEVSIQGDMRLTPFYDLKEVLQAVEDYVRVLNDRLQIGDVPPGFPQVRTADGKKSGSIAIQVKKPGTEGIACKLDSPALKALKESIQHVLGKPAQPFSLTGSLPLVRKLQEEGCDVQITGFGQMAYYHAVDEQAHQDHFRQGFAILRELLERL